MKSRWFFTIALSLALLLTAWVMLSSLVKTPAAVAEPETFYTSIHGGCYITGPNQCKIHVDPFTIKMSAGKSLKSFQILANRAVLYDFRVDAATPPPAGDYTPSLVTQDFAAVCNRKYTLNLVGRDSGDTQDYTLGQSGEFTCPASVP